MNKSALVIDELMNVPAQIKERSRAYEPQFLRYRNNRWVYRVGDYLVRIKCPKIQQRLRATLTDKQYERIRKIRNRDILVSCTCDFWKWNGPDFNAALNGYSERSFPDLSDPVVRDPDYERLICKHVYAALSKFKRDVRDAN